MSTPRIVLASCLMLLAASITWYLNHPAVVKLAKPLSTFPTQIGPWTGSHQSLDERENKVLKADDTLLGTYSNPNGRQIHLFISFYESQQEGRQIHSPRNCMPGAGWTIVESSKENLTISQGVTRQFTATKLLLGRANEKQVMLYWFKIGGTYIASEYGQKLHLLIDSVTRHRKDGAFFRLLTRVNSEDQADAVLNMKGFAELLIPVIEEYVPDDVRLGSWSAHPSMEENLDEPLQRRNPNHPEYHANVASTSLLQLDFWRFSTIARSKVLAVF